MLRHPFKVMRTPLTDSERRMVLTVIGVAVIALIPSVIGIGLVWHQSKANHRAAVQNKRLIRQLNEQTVRLDKIVTEQLAARAESRRRFQQSDLFVCREVEKLKKAQRDQALESFSKLDQTLKLLGVRQTPAIVEVARENRDRQLMRFAARKGGCSTLPSQKAGG